MRFYLVEGETIKRWCQVTILSFSDRLSAWNYDPFLVGICQCDKADDNIKLVQHIEGEVMEGKKKIK